MDTTVAAQLLYDSPGSGGSWRRSVDFYDEGELIWLEADVVIRQQSGGKKSLDDFTHLFHGGQSGPPMVKPYTFDDLVSTMNQVVAYDWRKFFTDRLTSTSPKAPLGGVEGSGWRLVYQEKPGELAAAREQSRHANDAGFSIGLIINEEGGILDATIGMPAYKAGIGPGMKVIAVNGRKYSAQV